MSNEPEIIRYYEQRYGPFTHMAPLDKSIWVRFLQKGGTQYAPFVYDLRVGDGVTMPTGSNPTELAVAYALTTKRIDAVSRRDGRVLIIEVKQRAGLGAVGQLTGYGMLYVSTFGNEYPVDLMLVTDYLQPDMRPILTANSINLFEVGQ